MMFGSRLRYLLRGGSPLCRALSSKASSSSMLKRMQAAAAAGGSIRVGDVELDDDTISHFIDTVGSATERDMNMFSELSQKHTRPAGGLTDDTDLSSGNIGNFRSGLEQYVSKVVEDTTESMVDELLALYDQHRDEYARSANPDFAEFPARDILDDAIDDADMVAEVVRRFHQRLSQRSSTSVSP